MYRLMVVEDEEMIRRGIVNSIDWHSLGYEVVGEARNGEDAIKQLKALSVDVILTDIKMPVMDGIELSKKARKLFPTLEIIILSGFSDFEYARQAISFRAFDYILKPTNKQKLLDAFSRLKTAMDQKREEKEEAFHNSVLISAGYENMRYEFLKALIAGDPSVLDDFDGKSLGLELDFEGSHFAAATIKFNKKNIVEELKRAWVTDHRLLKFSYSNIIEEILSQEDKVHYYVESDDTINFIFCFESEKAQERKMILCLEEICESIQNCLFRTGPLPYAIGIGLTYPSVRYIGKSYSQAIKSIQNSFYLDSAEVRLYRDNQASRYEQNFIQFYPEEMNSVVVSVCNGQYTETRQHLTRMFEGLTERQTMPEIVKNYCMTLLLTVKSSLSDSEAVDHLMEEGYMAFVKEAVSVSELQTYVVEAIVRLGKAIHQTYDTKAVNEQDEVVVRAKAYIRDHLTDKLSLKMISDHVYLSENYFSLLFKKATGKTYISYIQEIRMAEAKRLLTETDLKVYEVGERIGYNDYKYFTGQFRKLVAMTPKAYRKQARQ